LRALVSRRWSALRRDGDALLRKYEVAVRGTPQPGADFMTIQDDQLIYEYLGRVADAAQGRLAPLDRVQLVEDVRLRIETERQRGFPIPRILASLGSAELLVARSVGRADHSGPGDPRADDETVAFDDGTGTDRADDPASQTTQPAPYIGLVAPTVTPVPGTGGEREGSVWRRGILARNGDRSWAPATLTEAPSKATALVKDRNLLEIGALLFYTIGTVFLSYLGFLIAVGLTVPSKVWNYRDKSIAFVIVPAVTLATGVFIVWVTEAQDRSGSTDQRFHRAMGALGDFFSYWPWVAGFLSAGYLLQRLVSERRNRR